MGTSLTDEHVSILKKNVQSVTICYDSDSAGIEATYRAGNMLQKANCQVKVAIMPKGMDPDDYVKAYGEERFRQDCIGSSLTFMGFKMQYYRKGKNLQVEGDRLLYIEEVLKEISFLGSAVEKDLYLRQLADEFNLSLEALKEQEKQHSKQVSNSRKEVTEPSPKMVMVPKYVEKVKPAYQNAERLLIAHMLHSPDVAYKVQELLQGNTLNIDEHQAIITYLYGFYEMNDAPDLNSFLNYVEDENLRRIIVEIDMTQTNDDISHQELMDYINQVLKYKKEVKIKQKEAELKEAGRQKDFEKAKILWQEIQQIRKTL